MNIREFNVVSDVELLQTKNIQTAIDKAAEKNEVLIFPSGTYVTTTLFLQNNTHIILEEGALVIASPDYKDWKVADKKPLILAEDKNNICLEGKGAFSCNGEYYHDTEGNPTDLYSPSHTVEFFRCNNIVLKGITVRDSVTWTVHFNDCENILADGVIIRNPDWWASHCSDGFDINGCRHLEIKNCDIETGDDAICLKNYDASLYRKPMFDIHIHDCFLRTTSHGVKIGTETQGDVYDVHIENIILKKHRTANEIRYPDYGGYPLVALSIQSHDGASVHDISCINFDADVADTPLFIILQNRTTKCTNAKIGQIYNISVDNMKVRKCVRASQINVAEGGIVENVKISNFESYNFEQYSGEYKALVPEGRWYPDAYNYGHMPAYGLFARRVKNLDIEDNVRFYEEFSSGRNAVEIE